MRIDKLVIQELGHSVNIPPPKPDEPKKWIRLNCPFCKGRKPNTAAINYDAGWFRCYRCDKTISERKGGVNRLSADGRTFQKSDARRHAAQLVDTKKAELYNLFKGPIANVSRTVSKKFGKWFKAQEIRDQGIMLCWDYAFGVPGQPNDS